MFTRTERLLLRPAWREDAPALFHAIADEGIVRNLATAPWPYEPAHADAWVTTQRAPGRPALLIFRRSSAAAPLLVGGIGLHDTADGKVELGYWIARPFWGRGYATEAGRAVIGTARAALRIDRIVAGHFLDNPASGGVLRKLGFKPTGAVRARHSLARAAEAPCAEFELALGSGAESGAADPHAMMAA